jgi:adenylate cyclase class 2
MYEVELKFPVRDPERVWQRLAALGATWTEPVAHADRYFQHPSRNFVETDEALRIRTVGEQNVLTYKGPLLDALTKTRREIEVDVQPGESGLTQMIDILQHLGFIPVRTVAKTRRGGALDWQGQPVQWTWDDVPPLGQFVELELVVAETDRDAARDTLLQLGAHLQLGASERRSYLAMLLERDGTPALVER